MIGVDVLLPYEPESIEWQFANSLTYIAYIFWMVIIMLKSC
jgi:hypothetical protein